MPHHSPWLGWLWVLCCHALVEQLLVAPYLIARCIVYLIGFGCVRVLDLLLHYKTLCRAVNLPDPVCRSRSQITDIVLHLVDTHSWWVPNRSLFISHFINILIVNRTTVTATVHFFFAHFGDWLLLLLLSLGHLLKWIMSWILDWTSQSSRVESHWNLLLDYQRLHLVFATAATWSRSIGCNLSRNLMFFLSLLAFFSYSSLLEIANFHGFKPNWYSHWLCQGLSKVWRGFKSRRKLVLLLVGRIAKCKVWTISIRCLAISWEWCA